MRLVIATEDLARSVSEFIGAQRPIEFDHLALAMNPHRLYGLIKLRASHGKLAGNAMRTPLRLSLTRRLWAPIHSVTSPLMCQSSRYPRR